MIQDFVPSFNASSTGNDKNLARWLQIQQGTITRQSGWLLSKSLQAIMLERVWRKGNPLTLLVGMQTSTAAMENSVEIP